jgi:hypothetical protein
VGPASESAPADAAGDRIVAARSDDAAVGERPSSGTAAGAAARAENDERASASRGLRAARRAPGGDAAVGAVLEAQKRVRPRLFVLAVHGSF